MIIFDRVSKRYPNGREALTNVTFEVHTGEMVFLTGRSGAGKSTVLKLIALLERPTRGTVVVGGKKHEHDESAARARVPASHWRGVSRPQAAGRPAGVRQTLHCPSSSPAHRSEMLINASVPHLTRWDSWAKSGCCPWSCRLESSSVLE